MQLSHPKRLQASGFTFAEVCVAMCIAVLFGAAAFATNQRLLMSLKAQRESTAATMMLQERMEKFRGFTYSNVADKDFVSTNLVGTTTTSEAVLGNALSETITVSGAMSTGGTAGNYPTDGSTANKWTRDSAHPTGNLLDQNATLATSNDLLKVDILLTWKGADGRSRVRELTSVIGRGNIGQ